MTNKKETAPRGTRFFWFKIIVVLCAGVFAGWSAAMYAVTTKLIPAMFDEIHVPVPAAAPAPQRLPERTCEAIEVQLLQRIIPENSINPWDADIFLRNASVYSDLMRAGCPENSERFRTQAIRQLDIASAMHGDVTIWDVNDYPGRNFQIQRMRVYREVKEESEVVREARRIMERASRLGEPALRFISEIERVFAE
jgi:signal transduction histidine kinase